MINWDRKSALLIKTVICAAALCDVIGKSFAKALKCQYFKTSAKKNDNVDNAFQSVSECLAKEKTKDGQANHTRAYSNTNMHIHTHTCMLTYMLTHTHVLTHTNSLSRTHIPLAERRPLSAW